MTRTKNQSDAFKKHQKKTDAAELIGYSTVEEEERLISPPPPRNRYAREEYAEYLQSADRAHAGRTSRPRRKRRRTPNVQLETSEDI